MSTRRIGRRVALVTLRQIPCVGEVYALTLVTKVLPYPCPSFLPWAGWRSVGVAHRWTVVGVGSGWLSTGVWTQRQRGGARRFVCTATLAATPVSTDSLVTKEKNGGVG
jgi:hypothetical protein